MDYKETDKAARKFQILVTDFIKEYLKKYPTYDVIRERYENGERMCIDYRTLEISLRNESELKRACCKYLSNYEDVQAYNMIKCTTDEYGGDVRDVKYQDMHGIALMAVETYIEYNKIDDYRLLPAFLQ